MAVLGPDEWGPRVAAHRARVGPWVEPRLARRARGEKHPVDDFLWEYYSFRPGRLRQWHPGLGAVLAGEGADAWLAHPGYVRTDDGITASPTLTPARRAALARVLDLLERTAAREPRFGCFALHEWAMVYRLGPDEVRHTAWPLRLGHDGTDAVVESQPLRCTHYDAFRFYVPDARALNDVQPTRASQAELEQPGCLHATMDLYRWAAMFDVAVGSDLVADAFALARDVRALDMAASPYDLAGLGITPVTVETPQGRADFVVAQRGIAERGQELRERVRAALARLLHEAVDAGIRTAAGSGPDASPGAATGTDAGGAEPDQPAKAGHVSGSS